jgi:hypothetical protein
MSAIDCLFLCFGSYSEKLEVYISTFYKIRYILVELYVAVMRIISRFLIYIDQLNAAYVFGVLISYSFDCTAGVSWLLLAQKYYIEKCSLLARYWGTDGTTRIFHSAVQFLKSETAQISIRCRVFLIFLYS